MDAELRDFIEENNLFLGFDDPDTLSKEVRVMEILVLAEDTTTITAERFVGSDWRVVLRGHSDRLGGVRPFAYMTPSFVKEDFHNGV